MIAKRLGYVAASLVILASGIYLFVYLYRWEWNRALIAGVILVIAELALIGSMILDKLTSFEKRLGDLEAGSGTLTTLKDTAPPPKSRFRWLTGDGDLQVFVPVLMGAGVLFAGIAWLVERLARMTARPALEQGLAYRLAPLDMPSGPLSAPLDVTVPAPRAVIRRARVPVAMATLALLIAMSIDVLGDLTQNRPDARPLGGSGLVTLEVNRNGFTRPRLEAARSLWAACSGTVSKAHSATSFDALRGGKVLVVIEPAPGPNAQRRLRGCFDDATLDNIQARVLDISITR